MAKYPALDLRFAPGPGAGTLQDFLYAELDDFEPLAIHDHETGDGWRVFFRTSAQRDGARAALLSEFSNALLDASPVDVDDDDWARRSQANLTAIRVGRIEVAPPWDAPIVVIIEPSMGFGTGHHATTRLCLDLLQQVPLAGRSVIDVGTGSGVLAIAAAKLGAEHVIAFDSDADALQNAQENVERNSVAGLVALEEADLAGAAFRAANVVLANLTGAVLRRGAADLRRLLAPGGTFIVSGFGPDEFDAVRESLGAERVLQREEGDWMAAVMKSPA